jgi:Protein of unknown function (DUF2939)
LVLVKLRSPLLWLVGCAVILAGVWYIEMPRRAWQEFLHGLATDDAAAVDRTVDFAALRTNFRQDFTAVLARRAQGDTAAARHVQNLVAMLVDSMATRHGLQQLVTAFNAGPAENSEPVDNIRVEPVVQFSYRSPLRVDVRVQPVGVPSDQAGIYTFTLHGARWELTRVWSGRLAAMSGGS